jgi:manganese/zinc/iron transport system substrate-binding protein
MMRIPFLFFCGHKLACWALAWALFGLAGTQPAVGADARLAVVCTTGQVADMIRGIGGGHVRVQTLIPPGADPHRYELSAEDLRRLGAAQAVFYNGLGLEPFMAEALEALGRQIPVHAVTHDLRAKEERWLRKIAGTDDRFDPHVWLDVSLWARCADYVAVTLMAIDPAHAGKRQTSAPSAARRQ